MSADAEKRSAAKPASEKGLQETQGQVQQGMLGLMTLLQSVQQDTKDHAVRLAEIQLTLAERARDLALLTDETRQMARMLRGDADREGIATRIAVFDRALQLTTDGIKDVKELLESLMNENVKGRWAMVIAAFTGLIGLVGLIVAALLKK